MDSTIFLNQFKEEFTPSVKTFCKEKNKTGKVLLMIDKAPSHPSVKVLNEVDMNFKVQYLPPNVTATLQPMDQGVIEKMKG